MRALAEFVMRGRAQAILAALLGIVAPLILAVMAVLIGASALAGLLLIVAVPAGIWLSAAAVSLVFLRRGIRDGFAVLMWAILPAVVVSLVGFLPTLVVVIGATILAIVLRLTQSWPKVLFATAVFGVLVSLLLLVFADSDIQQGVEKLSRGFEQLRQQLPAEKAAQLPERLPPVATAKVSGAMGVTTAIMALVGVLLARWWQAMLYNPGGFREEFHRLRLPLPMACVLLAGNLLLALLGQDYQEWTLCFAVPFVVAGLALVHGLVGLKEWGRAPLVALYVALVVIMPITLILMMAALIDSSWDFRGRLRSRQP